MSFQHQTLFQEKANESRRPCLRIFLSWASPRERASFYLRSLSNHEETFLEILCGTGDAPVPCAGPNAGDSREDRKSTRLNSSHITISYAVFCLKKKKIKDT